MKMSSTWNGQQFSTRWDLGAVGDHLIGSERVDDLAFEIHQIHFILRSAGHDEASRTGHFDCHQISFAMLQ